MTSKLSKLIRISGNSWKLSEFFIYINPPAPCLQGAPAVGGLLLAARQNKYRIAKLPSCQAAWSSSQVAKLPSCLVMTPPCKSPPLRPQNHGKTREGGGYLPSWGGQKMNLCMHGRPSEVQKPSFSQNILQSAILLCTTQ